MQRVAEAICESLANGSVSEETVSSAWPNIQQPDYASVSFILPSNPALVVAFGNLAVAGPVKAAVHHVARCAAGLALGDNVPPPPPPQNAPRDLGWTDIKHAHKLGSKFVVVEPVPGWSSPTPGAVICLGWRKNVTPNRSSLTCASVTLLAGALKEMLRGFYNPLMKEVAGLTYWGTPVAMAEDEAKGTQEKLLTAADLEADAPEPLLNRPKQLPAYMGYKRRYKPMHRLPADAVVSSPAASKAKQAPGPWGVAPARSMDTLPPVHESGQEGNIQEGPRRPELATSGGSHSGLPPLAPANSPEQQARAEGSTPERVVVPPPNPASAPAATRGEGVGSTAVARVEEQVVASVSRASQVQDGGPGSSGAMSASDIDAQFPSPVKPSTAAWATATSGSGDQDRQPSGDSHLGKEQHPLTLQFRDELTERNYRIFSAVQHQQMDILVLAAAAIVGVAYGRMRVRPDGSPSAWFTINPWAEWYCLAQILFSGGMAAALLLKREWYLKNRDWLIMARNFALLCLSGVFSVPWTAGPQCKAHATLFKNFMTGLQLMQAFESWGSRINFSSNIIFRSICLAVCLAPTCCACAGESSFGCAVTSTVSFAVMTHVVPLYMNWRTEKQERTLFATLLPAKPKQVEFDCCGA